MILADTSVWIEHFRHGLPRFATCLAQGHIWIHSVVIGELATGNLIRRRETLSLLRQLPHVEEADVNECLFFIEQKNLFGIGIGWSDVHLLASVKLSGAKLWSLDRRLEKAAHKLGLQYSF